MKKINLYLVAGFIFSAFASSLNAAEAAKPAAAAPAAKDAASSAKTDEKYEILKRDQIDPTSTLAIPFDDSEMEDEEEINDIEGKQVFPPPPVKK